MRPLLVYLVEDSPVILESLVAALEELAPVRVVGTSADEAGALRELAVGAVDLVIVDLFLKTGSGLSVLRAMHEVAPCARHVVLSNYATVPIRERCLAMGADRVFDKSTEIDALIAYCARLASRRDLTE